MADEDKEKLQKLAQKYLVGPHKRTKKGKQMKKLKMKEVITEGMIQNAIAGILKLIYSGKIKQLKNDVEPLSKELAQSLDSLEKNIKKLNKDLRNPEIVDAFKQVGIDVTTWPHYKK